MTYVGLITFMLSGDTTIFGPFDTVSKADEWVAHEQRRMNLKNTKFEVRVLNRPKWKED